MSPTGWGWLLAACLVAHLIKLSGYLIPARWLERPRIGQIAAGLTVGLLASLTAMNTFSAGHGVVVDARVGALLAAAIALWWRLPFLLVVLVGMASAAGLRWFGVG